MMGHQSTFYLTPKDEVDLEQRLRQKTDLVILHSESPTSAPRIVDTLSFFENGRTWFFLYLARPEDLDKIVTVHVKNFGYWSVDCSDSPVVEFSRCRLDGNTLSTGRVYYVDYFLGPDKEWATKSEEFRTWAKMVHTTIKKSLKRRPSKKYIEYIGADAQAWVDAGGQLVTSDGRPVTW